MGEGSGRRSQVCGGGSRAWASGQSSWWWCRWRGGDKGTALLAVCESLACCLGRKGSKGTRETQAMETCPGLGIFRCPVVSAPNWETSAWEDVLRGRALGESRPGLQHRGRACHFRSRPLDGALRQRLHFFQLHLQIFFKYTSLRFFARSKVMVHISVGSDAFCIFSPVGNLTTSV